jgi:hypothetical protein
VATCPKKVLDTTIEKYFFKLILNARYGSRYGVTLQHTEAYQGVTYQHDHKSHTRKAPAKIVSDFLLKRRLIFHAANKHHDTNCPLQDELS